MYLLGLRDDLWEAVRRIRRNPRTSLMAAGTMALGIGAASVIGLAAGTAASLAAMRYLRSLLYGMSERDPWVYSGAIALALGTAVICVLGSR